MSTAYEQQPATVSRCEAPIRSILASYVEINIIYTKTLLHLPRWWDNLDPMIASKGQASVTRALPGVVASVFSSGQVPKLRPIIIEVVVTSPA
jgi:hypothetical protein